MTTEKTTLGTFEELRDLMQTCLRPHQFEVMEMLYKNNYSYEDVANQLKVTVDRVHKIEQDATRKLADKLKAKEPAVACELDDLGLSARTRNVLVRSGYTTVAAVKGLTESDFRSIGASLKIYNEVQSKLK